MIYLNNFLDDSVMFNYFFYDTILGFGGLRSIKTLKSISWILKSSYSCFFFKNATKNDIYIIVIEIN